MTDVLRCARCYEEVHTVRADNGVCAVCDLRDSLKAVRADRAYLARWKEEAEAEVERLTEAATRCMVERDLLQAEVEQLTRDVYEARHAAADLHNLKEEIIGQRNEYRAEVERLRQLHRDDCEWCSGEQQRRYAVEAERDMYADELAALRRTLQEGIEEMLALQQTPPEEDGEQP